MIGLLVKARKDEYALVLSDSGYENVWCPGCWLHAPAFCEW